jgi:hypothetical protein
VEVVSEEDADIVRPEGMGLKKLESGTGQGGEFKNK